VTVELSITITLIVCKTSDINIYSSQKFEFGKIPIFVLSEYPTSNWPEFHEGVKKVELFVSFVFCSYQPAYAEYNKDHSYK